MIRENVIDLRGSTQAQRQELYKVLTDLKESIYEHTTLTNRLYEYNYYNYNMAKWEGCRVCDAEKKAISIQAFISKYKKKEPKPGDTMSTIRVGDVYVNSSGKTCTIISTPTKDSPTTYTYRHQDGNTYIVDIGAIERNWVKQLGKSLDLYSRIVASNTVVHCETKEEAIQLLNWAHDQGLKWSDGTSYKEHTSYKAHTSDTCYDLKTGQYSGKEYVIRNNYTIIPFSSIPEFQSKEKETPTMTIKNLSPGTKVRVRDDLKEYKSYDTYDSTASASVSKSMIKFRGTIVTIDNVRSDNKYRIKEDSGYYNWTDEMFSEVITTPSNTKPIKQSKEKKQETQVAQQEPIKSKSIKKEETFMSKLKATALTTVDQNKEAAIIAAKMEAGRIINKQVIKQAAKHVPFWAKGYLDTPLAPVVLANAVAMLGNHTGNAKVQKVSELMLLAAADVTVQSFNLDKIIDDVLSGIKLPAGILDDVE